MNRLYMGILKRAVRAAVAAAVGTGIPAAIQYFDASTSPLIMAASPLITAGLMAVGKFLRDKFRMPNVPV